MADGLTLRRHVEIFARKDPVAGAVELRHVTPPPTPPIAAMAVEVFEVLSAQRRYGAGGPQPITLGDIRDYADAMRVPLTPREVDWVLGMDVVHRAAVAAEQASARTATRV